MRILLSGIWLSHSYFPACWYPSPTIDGTQCAFGLHRLDQKWGWHSFTEDTSWKGAIHLTGSDVKGQLRRRFSTFFELSDYYQAVVSIAITHIINKSGGGNNRDPPDTPKAWYLEVLKMTAHNIFFYYFLFYYFLFYLLLWKTHCSAWNDKISDKSSCLIMSMWAMIKQEVVNSYTAISKHPDRPGTSSPIVSLLVLVLRRFIAR